MPEKILADKELPPELNALTKRIIGSRSGTSSTQGAGIDSPQRRGGRRGGGRMPEKILADKELPPELNALTKRIIGACVEVHRALGPGLLESAYEACLCRELSIIGLPFRRQVPLPVEYKGARLDAGYQLDVVVDGQVVVELKAVETVLPVHEAQIITYLKLTGLPAGLLVNFNVPILFRGVRRFANTIKGTSASSASLR